MYLSTLKFKCFTLLFFLFTYMFKYCENKRDTTFFVNIINLQLSQAM